LSLRPEHLARLASLNLPAEALNEVLAIIADTHAPSPAAVRQARYRARKSGDKEDKSITRYETSDAHEHNDPLPEVPPKENQNPLLPIPLSEANASLVVEGDDPLRPVVSSSLERKRAERRENDIALLDEITDIWNDWAKSRGSPLVVRLSDKRAVSCRKRIADLKELGFSTPQDAFRGILSKCEESFFVRGSPRKPLDFDQLMNEGFMTRMIEGSFRYEEKPEASRRWAR